MIEARGLTKSYPMRNGSRYQVFKDLSFTIPDGKSLGLLGRNGAGKSTLLRILSGLESPDEGEVRCTGSVSWPVGTPGCMQGSLTGRENARFVARIHGLDDRQIEECVGWIEAFAEIGRHFDMPVKTYSSGMKSKLNFAMSMAFDFDYWLIDEITSVGDEGFRKKSLSAMKEKRAKSQVIMVTHNLREIADGCDYALLLGPAPRLFEDAVIGVCHYLTRVQGARG
jgi:capsular polysaccharide transport system ATP-binding protein